MRNELVARRVEGFFAYVGFEKGGFYGVGELKYWGFKTLEFSCSSNPVYGLSALLTCVLPAP